MTEQSKFPLPPEGQEPSPESASLIERAVTAFDLSKLAPPPVPTSLAPPDSRLVARARRKAEAAAQLALSSHGSASVAATEITPGPVTEPVPQPVCDPMRFTGERHPVDRQNLRELGMIVPEGSVTGLLEEFRIVKRQLLLASAELRGQGAGVAAQRVLVCSPHSGEGKTFCSINLALAMAAERESDVLLVDADFAKPSVLSTLGLPGGNGLMDALRDPAIDVAECVIPTDVQGLSVLPAGTATNADTEYLSSGRTARVLDRLVEGAPNRMVIFDSPPVLAASPAAELAKYVGQAVLVARADRTGQGALEDAVSLLSACPNIQLLLNAVQFSPSGRRFGSYYGYGQS